MSWSGRVRWLLGWSFWGLVLVSCEGAPEGSGQPGGGGAGASSSSGGSGAAGGSGGTVEGGSGGAAASGGGGLEEIPQEACRFGEEVAFSLPGDFGADQLDGLSKDSGGSCAEGELSFATLDMNGDLRPDLVVADLCDLAGVGTTHWLVHLNEGMGFASEGVEWTLPSGFATDQLDDLAEDSGGSCVEGELSFGVVDVDGDLRPDLVVADRCDIGGVGTTHWLVYANEGDRFADVALVWDLPSGFATDQLDDLADDSGGSCVEGELSFGVVDVDGDLRPDLVVADRCDIGGVGTTHWLVYANEGDRFADVALVWDLPPGFATDQLDDLADDSGGSCAEGELSFGLLDMDGDLRPELVVADRCDIGGVGTSGWEVYSNLGDGFASVAAAWALPPGFATDQLDDLSDDSGASCFQGELSFAVRDATGDLLPDLLVADDCDLEHTGTTHWVVYRGTGSGFEEGGAWALPGPTAGFGFDALDDLQGDDGALCAQGELAFAAIDLDGDRVLDLVVADDCDFEEVGTTHWRVFKGGCD